MTTCLIILATWTHSGVTGYAEHIAPVESCQKLATEAMKVPGTYQARATAYAFGRGEVVNAFNAGRFAPGWRF